MSHDTAKRPHGPSAYMIFSEEQRPKLMEKLRAEAADGKVPVTVVAKALGEAWKALPQDDKVTYQQKAKERAASAAAAAAAAADDQDTGQEQQQGGDAHTACKHSAAGAATGPPNLPRHIVKKIILTDEDVQRVSADAVWLLAETARLFLEQLAIKAAAAAASKKRKTVKLEDFIHVVKCDKRLVEAGLKDVASSKSLFEKHGAQPPPPPAAAAAGRASKQQHAKGPAAAVEADGQLGAAGDDALTDERLIAQEEERMQKAAEAAKVRAAKSADRKKAKQIAEAASTHKITTFFVSNKPDTLV